MSLQPLWQSLVSVGSSLLAFIPRLVNGLIVFLVGYLISWLVRWLLRFLFRQTRLELLFERIGLRRSLAALGMRIPLSELLAQLVFFFLLLSFSIQAVELMGLTPVAALLQAVLLFLPRAISAALLLLLGSLLARLLGNTVTAVARNVNIAYASALGRLIEYTVVAFLCVLALATLGVETTLLTTSLTIVVAAAGLAVALTFALGTREVARHVIAGYYVRQQFRRGQRVTLGEYSGTVQATNGAYTTLEVAAEDGGRRLIALPNALLLQGVAISEEPAPARAEPRPPAEPGRDQTASGDEPPSPPEGQQEHGQDGDRDQQ
ncbi:mechanosensitive ion channel family protein [Thermogemmatispora sp.]|uniref:mechanosensitive ion channel family protein n=1 Tax=Thermogemmatispora sp. TaxID=1968838 RepID=UPI001DC16C9B|nr:mechanosensitive ion channel [Thermogemmatispora sp.]MBX5450685.1 mechanosensitive ion channel [Thermogemmatispora sp.]